MPGQKRGHLQGGKFTASHTSVIAPATEAILAASRLACVRKISLGFIKVSRGGNQRMIKFGMPVNQCLPVTIRGASTVQIFYIHTDDPEEVQRVMLATLN